MRRRESPAADGEDLLQIGLTGDHFLHAILKQGDHAGFARQGPNVIDWGFLLDRDLERVIRDQQLVQRDATAVAGAAAGVAAPGAPELETELVLSLKERIECFLAVSDGQFIQLFLVW